ncbi:conserved hypothetical protein; possible membrane protein [Cytophaga hutchinsonii ATCC 33406]|uniref:Uncharacterized protein n=1 Tax=Cytophaga hutchinsonii (strain ATCC 33406 / DSM 1761 / CIP 103989 / NBRC 15051 / NCIMB 9469 / D465) TaxID=269798 RepID=A0A6N4SMJ8_CYTH3|nr:conserved hypothetical protein; possible membrane protein [Cytophaga hutchinsonii ATCC 33406]
MLYIYKDDIIYLATMQINKRLNTKVDVSKKIDISILEKFPELSIGFHDVKCYEPGAGKPVIFASVKNLFITFDIKDVWNGNYIIDKVFLEDGHIHLRTDENGVHNFMILKKDTSTAKSNSDFSISFIQLKNIDFIYDFRPSNHLYQSDIKITEASLVHARNDFTIHVTGDMHTDGIRINENNFLQNKDIKLSSKIRYNTESEVFSITPSTLHINTGAYAVEGLYDIKKSFVDLRFKTDKNDIQSFVSILPKAYAASIQEYKSTGNVYFNGTIKGTASNAHSPSININFGFDHATFYHPGTKQQITDAFLTGTYTNGDQHTLASSSVKLSDLKITIDNKPVSGYFYMNNFEDPHIDTHLKGSVILSKILAFVPKHPFEKASGEIDFDIEFKGRTSDLKTKAGYANIETSGDLALKNIEAKITSYPHTIRIAEAVCLFTKNDISIDNMELSVGKNDVVLNGIFRNLIGKIFFPNQFVYVQADMTMGNIFLEDILMSDTRSNKSSNQEFYMPALKDFILDLNLKANSMNYQKFRASKITSKIEWNFPYLNFTNSNLIFCNGFYSGKTALRILNEKTVEINADARIRAMNIDSLFYVFENFSQNFITNKNLKGDISADVSLLMQVDNHLAILPSSIICDADVTVQNGELNNFETMKRIARFLDTDNLDNIKFSEMRNHFLIFNEEIQIPDMTITSTAGKISFSGKHSFNGNIEYHVAYPIRNLKKEKVDSDAAFGALRADPKGEMKLFLIVQGTTSDFKISYDKKKTGEKIKSDLQKEKQELKNLFKKKEQDQEEIKKTQTQEQEYFDFD